MAKLDFSKIEELLNTSNTFSLTSEQYSVVIPDRNLVYTKSFKGTFEWLYLPQKDFWIIKQISETETKLTEIEPNNLPEKCLFQMVVAEQHENKVFVFIPSKNGDTVKEWRYFTDFFTGIIRNSDIS